MPPLVRKIEPGDIIGRCRTVRELGRGGVGTVYLAEHQSLKIEVALKVLSPALSLENPALAERFIREAQLAAKIRHPNVVSVMDTGHDEAMGIYYIVMEYVGGGSLAWHLRHGPLPEAKAFNVVTGIAQALVVAEDGRIVHRDIKPENIMLDLRGMAKLADLGLAKHSIDSHVSITIGGSFMGTPAYMSPDQARDAKLADTRDDIYSLGASFYECLTGEPPFQGDTPYNIMSELLTKPSPRPAALRPGLSRSADLICRKMMAKNRELRYPNARALLKDLQHAQSHGDSGLEGLEATGFDQDAVAAHHREQSYGIETSTDGVYAGEDEPEAPPARREPFYIPASKRTNRDVYSAAAILIGFVLVTTVLLAWVGPHYSFAKLQTDWLRLTGNSNSVPVTTPGPRLKEVPHSASTKPRESTKHEPEKPRVTETAPKPTPVAATSTNNASAIPPVALPVVENPQASVALPTTTDSPMALPVTNGDTNAPPQAVPAIPVVAETAFAARNIAEKSLDQSLVSPTGHAELLKIASKRDEGSVTPTTWTLYFYDKAAAGHARIVTVSGSRVIKSGEDLVDFASPYTEPSIMPEDKIREDSSDVLQQIQGLLPGATITSSEFTLVQQKNSVPMWKVTVWGKSGTEADRKLGDVTVLAENGTLIQKVLK